MLFHQRLIKIRLFSGWSRSGYKKWLKEADCFNEGTTIDGHNYVDGVKVSSASEAACKVGLGICRCMEFKTDGTKESEIVIGILSGNIKNLTYEGINRDIISQADEEYGRE